MAFCPNLSLPQVEKEFNELTSVVGKTMAYGLWNRNNGNSLDKAPNGNDSKLFKDLLELHNGNRAEAIKSKSVVYYSKFKDWFGDSKVVDSNGEPLIVYHGTNAEFDEFNTDKKRYNVHDKGIFFTDKPSKSKKYGKTTLPSYLSANQLEDIQYIDKAKTYSELRDLENKALNETNNDGALIITNDKEGFKTKQYVVFEPNQVKSVFNQGKFSKENDNIYKQEQVTQSEIDSVLQEFANDLTRRFNIPFELINEEEAKQANPNYNGEPAFFNPKTNKAYLVKGKANKTSAIHEIFTHPFLLQIEKTNPKLYANLLKEAKSNKNVVDYVDRIYGSKESSGLFSQIFDDEEFYDKYEGLSPDDFNYEPNDEELQEYYENKTKEENDYYSKDRSYEILKKAGFIDKTEEEISFDNLFKDNSQTNLNEYISIIYTLIKDKSDIDIIEFYYGKGQGGGFRDIKDLSKEDLHKTANNIKQIMGLYAFINMPIEDRKLKHIINIPFFVNNNNNIGSNWQDSHIIEINSNSNVILKRRKYYKELNDSKYVEINVSSQELSNLLKYIDNESNKKFIKYRHKVGTDIFTELKDLIKSQNYIYNQGGTNKTTSQKVLDHEYIARAIDLFAQNELDKQKDKGLIARIKELFAELSDYLKKLFNIPEVFSNSISPNITVIQLTQFAMYGKGKMDLNISQEEVNKILKTVNILTNLTDKQKQDFNKLEKNNTLENNVLIQAQLEQNDIESSRLFQTSEVTEAANVKFDAKEVDKTAKDIEERLLSFLKNNDILYRQVKSILDENDRDKLDDKVTAIYGNNVLRDGQNIKHLIEVLEGTKGLKNLPEETAHFIVKLLRGTPLYDMMMDKIEEFSIYDEVKESYLDFYNGDETLMKEEAIGKLVSDLLIKKVIEERDGLTRMANNWFSRTLSTLKNWFNGLLNNDSVNNFDYQVKPYLEVVDLLLNGTKVNDVNDVSNSLIMPNLSSNVPITEETKHQIKEFEKLLDNPEIKAKKTGSYELLNGTTVKNRVSDDVSANRTKTLKNNDGNFKSDPLPALKGTYVHEWLSIFTDEFNKRLTNVNSFKEVQDILTNYIQKMAVSDEIKGNLKNKVDIATRPAIMLNIEDYDINDIQSIESNQINSLAIGLYDIYIDIYKKAELIAKEGGSSFSKGSRPIIKSEALIYNKNTDTAGTIDLIVIQPNFTIDKYDFKTKQFKIDYKTKQSLYGYNELAKEGFDIQLLGYNNILESMGFDPKRFGASRIVPINVGFNRFKATKKVNPKSFKHIEMGYFNNKEYLKQFPVQGEHHRNKELDINIQSLFANREILMDKLKHVKGSPTKIKSAIERIESVLKALLIDNDLNAVTNEIDRTYTYVNSKINIPYGETGYLTLSSLNSLNEYLLNYKDIVVNAKAKGYTLEGQDKVRFEQVSDKITELHKLISIKQIEVINLESDIDVTETAEEVNSIKGLLYQTNEFNQPYLKRLNELIAMNEQVAFNDHKKLVDTMTKLDNAVNSWAKSNGMSKKEAFKLLYNHKSGQLIGRFSKEHFEKFLEAQKDKDITWLKANTNVGSKEYNDAVREKRDLLAEDLHKNSGGFLSDEEIQKKIDAFDYRYDIKTNPDAAFRANNYFIKLDEKSSAYSDNWNFINKPENKALLDYYEAYTNYNDEFSSELDVYISSKNIANIRASFAERIGTKGLKGFLGLKQFIRHTFEVREYEPDSANIDKTTKQGRKTIPLYFMDSLRQALTKKEGNAIREELDNDESFIKGSRKYENELLKRISNAEYKKGNEYKSFDLTKSLILFGEKVYTYKAYSNSEDLAIALRNVITSDKLKVIPSGKQGKLLKSKFKHATATINGVTAKDLELYDSIVNYYFYGEYTQNKDHLSKVKTIKDSEGNVVSTRKGVSTNKIIRFLLNLTSLKALGLNLFLASGNAINTISSIYIMASGNRNYNKSQLNDTIKDIVTGNEKFKKLVDYIEPFSRNLAKEIGNKSSAYIGARLFNMENMFVLHKKPDEFGDMLIMGAMAKRYGINKDGKLVNVEKNKDVKSIWESAKLDENGKLSIEGVGENSKAIIDFKARVKYEANQVKGSISPEASNMLNTNIYRASISQFKGWIKGLYQARLGKTRHNEVLDTADSGRFNIGMQQIFTNTNFLKSLKSMIGLTSEAVRMGIPFASAIGKKVGLDKYYMSKENLNKDAVKSYYDKYLVDNKKTSKDISEEDFLELHFAKMKELAHEIGIILSLIAITSLLRGFVPDDKDDPMYIPTRLAYKLAGRGLLEMSFWFDTDSFFSITSNSVPLLRTLKDLSKWAGNTADVMRDMTLSKNNSYRAILKKSKHDKKPLFYETSKNIPGLKTIFDIFDIWEKPLDTRRN